MRTPSPRGQRELKGRTPSCFGARPQTATMGLNYPSTDGQPHSGSLRFGGEERLKNAFGFLSWKPCPRVTHRNQQLTIFGPRGRDAQLTALILHCLDAVEHQVHQYLLQLNVIRCRRWKRCIEICSDRNRLTVRRIVQQNDHLSDDFVQVNRLALWSPSPVE